MEFETSAALCRPCGWLHQEALLPATAAPHHALTLPLVASRGGCSCTGSGGGKDMGVGSFLSPPSKIVFIHQESAQDFVGSFPLSSIGRLHRLNDSLERQLEQCITFISLLKKPLWLLFGMEARKEKRRYHLIINVSFIMAYLVIIRLSTASRRNWQKSSIFRCRRYSTDHYWPSRSLLGVQCRGSTAAMWDGETLIQTEPIYWPYVIQQLNDI